MRRLALIGVALIGALAWWLTTVAGADSSHTYKIEMYNAFGIVNGSEVRVAGVQAGTVTGLDVNAQKRAVATVSLSGPVSVLGKDTHCAAQPQSLIAEYFIDCTPQGPPLPDGGTIPASHVRMTVQNDLVFDTLRLPYRERLTMIINEFGTALAGNSHDLNQAIRLGSPALFELRKVLAILGRENSTIRDLNVNSDRIISRLAANKANVIRFIQKARDTAAASAAQRTALSADFNLLDNFLHELHPTSVKLAATARQTTPLLTDLHAAAPQLNELTKTFPPFNRATEKSLQGLGRAAVPGRQALRRGRSVIQALKRASPNARPVADTLDKFLADIQSPKRYVIQDRDAAYHCAPGTKHAKVKPCYSTGRKFPTGYTALEGLINYAYYQAGAINQFDAVGHLLHFSLYDVQSGPCGNFTTGYSRFGVHEGVPAKTAGTFTKNILNTAPCVSWLGQNQPGINQNLHLPPYDPAVCKNGVSPTAAESSFGYRQVLKICDPNGQQKAPVSALSGGQAGGSSSTAPPNPATSPSTGATGASGTGLPPVKGLPPGVVPQSQDAVKNLENLLGIGHGGGGLPGKLKQGLQSGLGKLGGQGHGTNSAPTGNGAVQNLLDFLFTD